jgi:hypothetical protein
MSRLAFIRLFFEAAIGQSRQPDPLNVQAVLTLHDTIELFLQLAADHLGASLPQRVTFMEYWRQLDPASLPGGVRLSGERPMRRLNDLRIAFKHHGTLPSAAAIQQACTDVRSFLDTNTALVFGIAFADIDMAEVIPQPDARAKVRAATAAAAAGDLVDAMGLLAETYDDLFAPSGPGQRGPAARFGSTINDRAMREMYIAQVLHPCPQDKTSRSAVADYRALASLLDGVIGATSKMQGAMRIMALGIEYPKYERFRQLTPRILRSINGVSDRWSPPGYAPTSDEFDFCREFIITVALRLAEQP